VSLTKPTRLRVLEEFQRRLAQIHGDGFHTNAGHKVFVGESPELGEDDPVEAIAVLPLDDQIVHHQKKLQVLWPIEVHALTRVDPVKAWQAVELIVGDIKVALELDDREFDGDIAFPGLERLSGTRTRPRESGSRTVGVVLPYLVRVQEVWGNPT